MKKQPPLNLRYLIESIQLIKLDDDKRKRRRAKRVGRKGEEEKGGRRSIKITLYKIYGILSE